MAEFALPDVGEGLTEAVILTWCVAVGDEVAINDVLLEIETAKSIVELPSPFAGVVDELLVAEGDTVDVGTPIVRISDGSQEESEEAEPLAESAEADGPEGGVLVGYGPRKHGARRRRRGQGSPPSQPRTQETRVLAKPPVRRLAKELGIDLAEVPHEGACVTRADLEAWADVRRGITTPNAQPTPRSGGARREPVSQVRKATAEAMVSSAFTAPHASEWVTVDVSASVDLLETLRKDSRFAETPVSIMLLAARAVCLALSRHETLHAHWEGDAISYPEHVGLGIAAATERGLLVPVIPAAETLSTQELATAINEMVASARSGRIPPERMTGGTFTITNVGVFGVDGGTPILPPGQSGILALGAVDRRPWVDEESDTIVPRWVTTLSLSFDHRVVDGEQASRFLSDVARLLHDPALALTY